MLKLFFSVADQLIKGLELIEQTVTDPEEFLPLIPRECRTKRKS